MPTFSFTAQGPDGALVTGVQKAADRAAAELVLVDRGLRGIRLAERAGLLQKEILAPRVKRQDLMHLSKQLAAFVGAGLTIIDAVQLIASETKNSALRRVLEEVDEGLRGGEAFSDCLERHPKTFPELYRGMLRTAELSGQLDKVLEQLATYLDRDLKARNRIRSAMLYPLVIAGMSLVTVVVLAGFVMPKFEVFFKSFNAKLPLPTRILLGVTHFMTTYWLMLGGSLVVIVGAAVLYGRTESGKLRRDQLVLRIPVVGETVRCVLVERFCRCLASMVDAGVPLPEALRVSSASLRNRVFVGQLTNASKAILQGEGLSDPLDATKLFPPTATQMFRVGEETGTLSGQLESTASYYESEVGFKIDRLTSLFEPAVILAMGSVVGFVAIALVSAMYGIYNQVQV